MSSMALHSEGSMSSFPYDLKMFFNFAIDKCVSYPY